MADITLNNSGLTNALNLVTSNSTSRATDAWPPNAPINFGSLKMLFNNMSALDTEPSSPSNGDVYLDDGTNTSSGVQGFRRFDGTNWTDIGLQSVSGVAGLNDLSDVTITEADDGDRLVYDIDSGKWVDRATIDGGTY